MGAEQLEPKLPKAFSEDQKSRTKSNSVISTDFETAIRKAGCGKFNLAMILIAIPASCTSGFVTATTSYVVPVAGVDLGLTPSDKALLQSAAYCGMICSAFFWGVLSDSLGRQKLLATGFLLDFVMNTGAALIPYLPAIFIFKFLSGCMVCGPYSIFMAYISEVFLDKQRDMAVLSAGIFSSIGAILQASAALFLIPREMPVWLPLRSWQVFILFCGLPSLLAGTACLFTVESPKFLAEKGKSDKALDICKTIYTINTGHSADSYPVRRIHYDGNTIQKKKTTLKSKFSAGVAVLKPPYILRLLLVFSLQICIASTMNILRLWLPEILTVISNADFTSTNETTICPLLASGKEALSTTSKVISRDEIYYYMMIVNAGCLVAHICFIIAVKFIGKKFIIMAVAAIALGCTLSLPNINGEYIFIPSAILISVLNIAFFSAVNLVVEIFPTAVRATSVSLQMMFGRIGILNANFLFTTLIYSYCDYVFYMLSGGCVCMFLIVAALSTKPIAAPGTGQRKL